MAPPPHPEAHEPNPLVAAMAQEASLPTAQPSFPPPPPFAAPPRTRCSRPCVTCRRPRGSSTRTPTATAMQRRMGRQTARAMARSAARARLLRVASGDGREPRQAGRRAVAAACRRTMIASLKQMRRATCRPGARARRRRSPSGVAGVADEMRGIDADLGERARVLRLEVLDRRSDRGRPGSSASRWPGSRSRAGPATSRHSRAPGWRGRDRCRRRWP